MAPRTEFSLLRSAPRPHLDRQPIAGPTDHPCHRLTGAVILARRRCVAVVAGVPLYINVQFYNCLTNVKDTTVDAFVVVALLVLDRAGSPRRLR